MLGSVARARHIASRIAGYGGWPDDCELIGRGDTRMALLCLRDRIVYKVGSGSCNEREHEVLTAAREAGEPWAPVTTLWRVEYNHPDGSGDLVAASVVVMPYLPDDGSVERPYPMFPVAGDLSGGNVHANKGRFWLIDAGGLP